MATAADDAKLSVGDPVCHPPGVRQRRDRVVVAMDHERFRAQPMEPRLAGPSRSCRELEGVPEQAQVSTPPLP